MTRASNAFSVLQAIAVPVVIATLLWSVGLPNLRFAEAANVTSFSDTLSTSQPSVAANHTIEYVATNGVSAGETIVLTFDPEGQAFDLTDIGEEDVDLLENGSPESVGTNWLVTVNTSLDTITLTSQGVGGVIASGSTTTILVGTHATNDGTADTQIDNPASAASYEIDVTSGSQDTGSTRVAILDTVTVTASVDTLFTFSVAGVAQGETVNGTTTGTTTTPTEINFGQLVVDTATTAAQDLTVVTNSKNGFVVTVTADGQLDSTTGADIDGFRNGSFDNTPVAWQSPAGTVGSENTYGHWGITSDDTDYFAAPQTYVSASTTPVEVFAYDGPTDGTITGDGTTRVGYTVEISSLQEAADDYQAVLTYVATPVF